MSYVRCQRCERPVCPECQRTAAVGVQCVDCVREHARTMPRPRTVLGGTATDGRPVVTTAIIAVCAAVFVLQLVPGLGLTNRLAYVPALTLVEPWRLLASTVAHSTGFLPHILFNCYVLWYVGGYLEYELGRVRLLALFLVCGLGGSVGSFVLADPTDPRSWFVASVGASGAVFGLFGVQLVVDRRLGRDSRGLVVLLLVNGVIGFLVPGIAWQAHLGGFLTGLLAGAALAYAPRARRTTLHAVGLVGVAMLLGLVVAAKVATVPAGLV